MSIQFPAYATTVTTTATGDLTITNVVLQLHGDGIAASTNLNFIDSSTNNFTITRTGTPTQGSINPFGSNWSTYFNGSTDYLAFGGTTTSGNFTIECWFYQIAKSSTYVPIISGSSGSYNFPIIVDYGTGGSKVNGSVGFYTTSGASAFGGSFSLNSWNHIALVRNGSTFTMYLNGLQACSTTDTSNVLVNTVGGWSAGPYLFNGYISNARVVNGTALYTTAFTPSTTPLTTVTNTVLLTAAANRFQDVSTLSNAITVTGSVTVQRFAPFPALPATAYTTATSVTTYSGSIYFNGSTDFLTVPSNAGFSFGTGDFTVECWIYTPPFSNSYGKMIVDARPAVTNGSYWTLGMTSNGTGVGFTTMTVGGVTANGNIVSNAWNHVAATRQGTTLRLFINGVVAQTITGNSDNISSSGLFIGINAFYSGAPDTYFTGYMSNIRIIKGTAVYTANFTPPTAPLTTVTNTQLLLLSTNAGIVDTTMQNDIVTVGSAQISTATVKYGSGSIKFNGSTDYLNIPQGPLYNFGSSNWTIESWIYFNSVSATQVIMNYGYEGSTQRSFVLYFNSDGTLHLAYSTTGSNNTDISFGSLSASTATWYHIAIVRNGSTITAYKNGTALGTTINIATNVIYYPGTAGALRIGTDGTNYFNGYLDDYRITNGVARYTATFTPPTAAFPDVASSTVSTTTFTTSFTTANNVYATVTTTGIQGQGGTSVYTTSTGLFAGTSVVHTYTNPGISYFTATNTMIVSYLAVGGGGAGGDNFGGGGGAGGFITGTFTATLGNTYVITVGTGGANAGRNAAGNPGSSSTITATGFTSIIAWGGGGGATCGGIGLPGASGGGSARGSASSTGGTATPPGQGNTGGGATGSGVSHGGGGGGGAGSVGTTSSPSLGGTGGSGSTSTITGAAVIYAGGGGGGGYAPGGAAAGAGGPGGGGSGNAGVNSIGTSGTPNTGGGGGGSGGGGSGSGGGVGGPGIVILSYSAVSTATVLLSTGSNVIYNYANGRWTLRPFNTATLDISYGAFANQANTATTAFAVSAGCTGQRSLPTQTGAMRFNSALNVVETYNTTYNTWTSITAGIPYTIEYLVVAAGGAASSTAGGGAGGALAGFASVTTGNSYTVSVGQGSSSVGGASYIAPTGVTVVSNLTVPTTTGTGGTYYTTSTGIFSGTSVVHVFTATGTSYFTATSAIASVAYLVVAGGGGGGGAPAHSGGTGGGGAGGLVTGTFTATAGTTYTITVGAGGAGGFGNPAPAGCYGLGGNGGYSSIVQGTTVVTTATGGGGGAGQSPAQLYSGNPGGSGGGGTTATNAATGIPGQGYPGGVGNTGPAYNGGGGGGAGGAGGTATAPASGAGGASTTSNISGTLGYYAGGGGGAAYIARASGGAGGTNSGGAGANSATSGTPGVAYTGGGGGGAGGSCSPTQGFPGGNGGPGIVVLSYTTASSITIIINSSSAIAYAYGGSTGTTQGGASGAGIVGQGYTVSSGTVVTTGTGGTYSTTSTGLFPGSAAVHVFTGPGTFTAGSSITAAYLVVAGGGGGGSLGGGGGAGGMLTGTTTLSASASYTVTVGTGGGGGPNAVPGGSGNPSSLIGTGVSITATGGGGGGSYCGPAGGGGAGGSGGGGGANPAGGAGVPGQGYPGGTAQSSPFSPGGGGGAGGAGTPGVSGQSGPGGIGLASRITGVSVTYAGGGGAGAANAGIPPLSAGTGGPGGGGPGGVPTGTPGTTNTGGGGGGGGYNPWGTGGSGGPGIVIISYALNPIQTAGAGAYSSTGTGIFSQVTGAQVTYGAGGAATGSSPGGTNTGNGGSAPGGTGAPGVVYIRYLGGQRGTGGAVSTVGTYTLHTFVSTGTFTA